MGSRKWIERDIYLYRPQDLAALRDALFKLQRAQERKQRERERLYRIEGSIEADVVYDSDDLIVRHIKNKAASAHYGLNTKWCISMLREGYFEDYDTQNATFFFFERKSPKRDEFDKVALVLMRSGSRLMCTEAFTTLDQRVDMILLAKVFGTRIFDVFREIYERSERHPASAVFQIYRGQATATELETAFEELYAKKSTTPFEAMRLATAICCNDNAEWPLLEKITRLASKSILSPRRLRAPSRLKFSRKRFERDVKAALAIHPKTPDEVRVAVIRSLRRGGVKVESIRRVGDNHEICVAFDTRFGSSRRRHRRRLRNAPPSLLLARAGVLERKAARLKKKAKAAIRTKNKKRNAP